MTNNFETVIGNIIKRKTQRESQVYFLKWFQWSGQTDPQYCYFTGSIIDKTADNASLLVLMVIHPFFYRYREIQQARPIRPTLSRARVVWRLHLYCSSTRHNFDSIHVLCILYIKVHMYSRVVLIGTYRISYFLSASHWAFICSLSQYWKPAGVYSFAGVGVLSINNPHTHPSSSAGTIKIIRSVVNLGRSVHFRLQSEYGGR